MSLCQLLVVRGVLERYAHCVFILGFSSGFSRSLGWIQVQSIDVPIANLSGMICTLIQPRFLTELLRQYLKRVGDVLTSTERSRLETIQPCNGTMP